MIILNNLIKMSNGIKSKLIVKIQILKYEKKNLKSEMKK